MTKKCKGIIFIPYFFILPTIFMILILLVTPIIMVIGYSFFDNVIMNKNPQFIGIGNYIRILTDRNFITAFRNSLKFTIFSVIFHLVIGLIFALLLNSKSVNPILRSIFRVIYILPWVFTSAIVAVLWRLLLNPNGVINFILLNSKIITSKVEWLSNRNVAMHSVIFINIWAGYPFYMVSLLAGMQGISKDFYEAATVDGANGFQKFLYITIPQLKPIIYSMAMLDFIWTMQVFNLIWMTTGGGPIRSTEMLSTYTYKFAFSKYEFSVASASAVVILLFSIAMVTIYVRNQKAME